jgi:large subunit ribosomal protein L13
MSTFSAKSHEVVHDWYILDASNQVLGRLASRVARYLRGKHKAEFTPHVDTGDYVVIVNADKIMVTGKKFKNKQYYRHSGYPGGIKSTNFETMQTKAPGKVIELAVRGMLPKNTLGRSMLKKLKVYAGDTHPHAAQQPKPFNLED